MCNEMEWRGGGGGGESNSDIIKQNLIWNEKTDEC